MLWRKLWKDLTGRRDRAAPRRAFTDRIGQSVPHISIVDVGAMAEGVERYHGLVESGLARVTGFEPNAAERARLFATRGGAYQYLPDFLGDGNEATFHETRYPGCASLLAPDPRSIDLFTSLGCASPKGNFHVERTQRVQTTRMDDLGDDVVIDFLKLDIQGAELDVLRNATVKLESALVIECEVEFIALYRDQPLFGDVQCFLRDQGFALHKLVDVSGRPFSPFVPANPFVPISQILWADAIFIRDFTRLERYSDEGLLKTAAIVDVVYGSYDLAALLLSEYDRRRGTRCRTRYVEALGPGPVSGPCLNIRQRP